VTTKTKSRLIVFFVGIMICLVVLEVSLRVVGSIYGFLSETDQRPHNAQTIILSIGDSVTFGIGAPLGFSYPAQLQKMLNEAGEAKKEYAVINRGRPGQNSAQILTRLEGWLQEFKPNIVTLLIGAQNQVNFFGYQEYLQKSDKQKRGFFLSLHDLLDNIRIYKFFRLLVRDDTNRTHIGSIQNRSLPTIEGEESPGGANLVPGLYNSERKQDAADECSIGATHRDQGNYDMMLAAILKAAETREIGAGCCNVVGSIYKERNLNNKAITWFKKGIEQDPTRFDNYAEIGWLYNQQEQWQEALSWFKKGFKSARHETLYEQCYVGIALAFEKVGDTQGALDFFAKEEKNKSGIDQYLYTLAGDYLSMFRKNKSKTEVYGWIEADIEQMLELCNRYNSKAILQNYPAEPEVNFIYEQVARRQNIPFVDHQSTFKKYIKDGVRSEEYFVADGHPNRRGYNLMAKNIWMILKGKVQ